MNDKTSNLKNTLLNIVFLLSILFFSIIYYFNVQSLTKRGRYFVEVIFLLLVLSIIASLYRLSKNIKQNYPKEKHFLKKEYLSSIFMDTPKRWLENESFKYFIVYTLLFISIPKLGFFVSSLLFVLVYSYIFGKNYMKNILIFSVFLFLLIKFVFVDFLDVILPRGIFF